MRGMLYGMVMLLAAGIGIFHSSLHFECTMSEGDIYGRVDYSDGSSWRFSVLSQGVVAASTAGIKSDMTIIPDIEAGFLVFRLPILE